MYWIEIFPRSIHSSRLSSCHQLLASHGKHGYRMRDYSSTSLSQKEGYNAQSKAEHKKIESPGEHVEQHGGMSRRLEQMTDESIERGGRSVEKIVEEAGFSKELKRQLEERIMNGKFKSDHPAAFAQINMPSSAGQGTRAVATARPWTGVEVVEDTALRMLTDAHKPLRTAGTSRIPTPGTPSPSIDLRMKKASQKSQGQRLANARDRTSAYALSQDPHLSENERGQMQKQLKERFTPGASPMPATLQGLAALANERIEDAIARGQFKNVPRGKGKNIERDYTASSPFLDTTEYFMNKIIQKQEIVPPWIEKQQELVKSASVFRNRLRADWKRHAARVIASKGGSLEAQIARATAYAAAEASIQPRTPKDNATSQIGSDGRISHLMTAANSTSPSRSQTTNTAESETPLSPSEPDLYSTGTNSYPVNTESEASSPAPSPSLVPFRDPNWEATERNYHTLAITSLNNLTRSYNLQAPKLAERPYFSLTRELAACYADVAPLLPDEILARAQAPKTNLQSGDAMGKRSVFGRLSGGGGGDVRIVESARPYYGFREFWRELWGKGA